MADGQSKFDFEKNWQDKLSRAVEENLGKEIRDQVIQDGDSLSDDTPSEEKIRWTCEALNRLGGVADKKIRQEILVQCACQYP